MKDSKIKQSINFCLKNLNTVLVYLSPIPTHN